MAEEEAGVDNGGILVIVMASLYNEDAEIRIGGGETSGNNASCRAA